MTLLESIIILIVTMLVLIIIAVAMDGKDRRKNEMACKSKKNGKKRK